MTILLIDPDEYYHQQFSNHMSRHFDITAVKDSGQAQKLLASECPDMVVMELLLADGASFTVLEELRKTHGNSAVPVVIFSKIDNLEDIEHTLSLGVSGYFVKGRDTINDVHNLLLSLNPKS